MNLTIDVSPDLESRLNEEAAKQGVPPSEYALRVLRNGLGSAHTGCSCLGQEESELIEEINRGLTEPEWKRYYDLVEKRRAGKLVDEEVEELTNTTERFEALNVRRIECLARLAALRGEELPDLMQQLGIEPPPVI